MRFHNPLTPWILQPGGDSQQSSPGLDVATGQPGVAGDPVVPLKAARAGGQGQRPQVIEQCVRAAARMSNPADRSWPCRGRPCGSAGRRWCGWPGPGPACGWLKTGAGSRHSRSAGVHFRSPPSSLSGTVTRAGCRPATGRVVGVGRLGSERFSASSKASVAP